MEIEPTMTIAEHFVSVQSQSNEQRITIGATLQELPLKEAQIELDCLGEEVFKMFEEDPLIPGIILTERGQFMGMVSRQRFFEYMSRPYSLDLYLKRPIYVFHRCTSHEFLVLPSNTSIIVAALKCLQRSLEWLFEPLVVAIEAGAYRLLNVHELLLAQAQIHQITMEELQKSQQSLFQELAKGQQIQRNFLPAQLLQVPGWEIAAFFKPAGQVAGDFYDTFELPDNTVGLVIADVCDKGVGAALFMALFRSLIRLFSGQTSLDRFALPGHDESTSLCSLTSQESMKTSTHANNLKAVRLINDYVAKNHSDLSMFATLFFGVLDPATGLLNYINGGHEPLFIITPSGGVRECLNPTGPAVGILPNVSFEIHHINLEPGDILLGYTDGVPEARCPSGQFFTKERLLSMLEQSFPSSAILLERITTSVLAHTGKASQFDDIAMLAVRRLPYSATS
ncbi:MAG: SpoIIE family protein phosphatase [Chroococcidiopsidaceae cyanobacterium CP_BM_ER_R8_30]|nr:SpoIIE family protein phosphatase [Chroococcidiopsidaceae cyanobacterium CP_BM_ER_R8_30]